MRRRGLTIVEVTVALALLSVVLAGAFGALAVSQRADVAAREHRAASDAAFDALEAYLGTQDLEAMIARGASAFHAAVDTGHGAVNLTPASAGFFDPGGDDPAMAGHVRLVLDPDEPAPPTPPAEEESEDLDAALTVELVEVQVTVAWRSHDGADRRVDVVSRRAR